MPLAQKLGKRLRLLRKKYGYTQERLADLSGIDYKHLQKLEGKTSCSVKIDTIEKLAKAFKMTTPEFLDF